MSVNDSSIDIDIPDDVDYEVPLEPDYPWYTASSELDEAKFIFGNVIKYDSIGGTGTVEYVDKEDGETKTATFEATKFELLMYVGHKRIGWHGTQGMFAEEPEPVIAFTDVFDGKVDKWINEGYARIWFIYARSTYYTLYRNVGVYLWNGYLTNTGEVFGTEGALPRELEGEMFFEAYIEGDEEFDGDLNRLSDHDAANIWKQLVDPDLKRIQVGYVPAGY